MVAGCGSDADPQVGYKPPLVPVKFKIGPDGVTVEGESAVVTPLGTFSYGAQYKLASRDRNEIDVIIVNRDLGVDGTKWIYRVQAGTGSFKAVVDGHNTIEVSDDEVTIDVTDGSIKVIELAQAVPASTEVDTSSFSSWWETSLMKWDTGWATSFYRPFALARWAYNDSTIDKAWGLGFVWFLIRLFFAILLSVVDIVLTAIFLISQVGYYFFDSTGRNIVWGVSVLLVIGRAFVALSDL